MSSLHRELAIRKRVLEIFNKTQQQFPNDEQWFDYQELVEDHIYKLVEGQDVQQTEAAIEEYRKANYADIVANDAKKRGRVQPRITGLAVKPAEGQAATQSQPSAAAYTADQRPSGFGQPQPTAPAAVSSQAPHPLGGMDAAQRLRMALASGWTPELVQKRSLQLAFCSF
ncbi:hypothetical protein ABBQ38_004429 [Trebouxia sp. C0009 RCD-2024]